jgi:integrase
MTLRRPSLQHPLADIFTRAIDSLCTAMVPNSRRVYDAVAHSFLVYLGSEYPAVTRLDQLRRDPHLLGWMAHLRAQSPPLATSTYVGKLFALRALFYELITTSQLTQLAHLMLRQDIPRMPKTLPRPLTAEQDQLLAEEFMRRNDLGSNIYLLLRNTGMRISECADLCVDCLRSTGPDQWAVHVPLGKFKRERMVPVDAFTRDVAHRLRFFRSLHPRPEDGRLLARSSTREALIKQMRNYLYQVRHALGLSTRIVPHQFRHTYATEMLRNGVSLPVLMKLLGHTDPAMTMRYVDVVLTDIEREVYLARSNPRHLAPQPRTPVVTVRAGINGLIDSLLAAQHLMEMFRRSLPDGKAKTRFLRLSNRLTKILSETKNLNTA